MKDSLIMMALHGAHFLFIDDLEQHPPAVKAICLVLRAMLSSVFLFGGVLCLMEGTPVGWAFDLFVIGCFLALGLWVLLHAIRLIIPGFLERKRP